MPQIIVEKQFHNDEVIDVKMCPVGYIYGLYLANSAIPFYVGKSNDVFRRYNEHLLTTITRFWDNENTFANTQLLYEFIRDIPEVYFIIHNPDLSVQSVIAELKDIIRIRIIRIVDLDVMSDVEKRCIKYCFDRGVDLKNSCGYSNRLKKRRVNVID